MDESLRNLPPKERIKAIRELHEKKQRELEELEKQRKQELEETEDAVKQSLEDIESEEREAEKQLRTLQKQLDELEEESLEERVAGERTQQFENNDYQTPTQPGPGYTPLGQIVTDLERLSGMEYLGTQEQALLDQRREELEQTELYRGNLSDALVRQLDTAEQMMNQLGYKK